MRFCVLALLAAGLILSGTTARAAQPKPNQEQIVAEVRELGGAVDFDVKDPNHPIVKVDLGNTRATDADLARLKSLPDVRWLSLWRTQITDKGLEHLKGLSNLTWLDLSGTHISND